MYLSKLNEVLEVKNSQGNTIFHIVKCKDKNHFGIAFAEWVEPRNEFNNSCDTRIYFNKEIQSDILNGNKIKTWKEGYGCGGNCLSSNIFKYLDVLNSSLLKGFTPVSIAKESCNGGDYFYGIMLIDGIDLESIKQVITELFIGSKFNTEVYINWRWYVLGDTWFPELWM